MATKTKLNEYKLCRFSPNVHGNNNAGGSDVGKKIRLQHFNLGHVPVVVQIRTNIMVQDMYYTLHN